MAGQGPIYGAIIRGTFMDFWILAFFIAALAAAALAIAALRAGGGRPLGGAEADLALYRAQMGELEADIEKGLIRPDEATQMRNELSRRLLEADRRLQTGSAPVTRAGGNLPLAIGLAVVIFAASTGLYLTFGAPGYSDLPLTHRKELAEAYRVARPTQAAAEANAPVRARPKTDPADEALVQELRDALTTRQDDVQGHRLLAISEARLGNFIAARKAQSRVIELLGDEATAADWADLADLMALAADGYVSPEAEAAARQAMKTEPENGTARYYLGLMYAQTGRPDLAFDIWRGLIETTPANAPWQAPVAALIGDVADEAGVKYTPPAATGPTADDIAAASDMDAGARAEMVQTMVEGLAERLATSGGPPEDWAQLIRSLTVLGQNDRAKAILAEAEQVFADHPDALATIRAAATEAGLGQ